MACLVDYSDNYFFYPIFVCGILSLFASSFIILFYLFSKTKTYSIKLIFYIAMSEFILSTQYIIPISYQTEINTICISLAIMFNTADISGIVWITYIAIIIYQVIVNSNENYEKYEIFWIVFAWIMVPLLNSIPIFTHSIGAVGNTCTYTQDLTGNIIRFSIFYFPAWALICVSVFCYFKVFSEIKLIDLQGEHKKLVEQLSIYPVVISVKMVFMTCLRAFSFFIQDCALVVIELIFSCIIAICGFVIGMIFLRNPSLKNCFDRKRRRLKVHSVDILNNNSSSINLLDDTN